MGPALPVRPKRSGEADARGRSGVGAHLAVCKRATAPFEHGISNSWSMRVRDGGGGSITRVAHAARILMRGSGMDGCGRAGGFL